MYIMKDSDRWELNAYRNLGTVAELALLKAEQDEMPIPLLFGPDGPPAVNEDWDKSK